MNASLNTTRIVHLARAYPTLREPSVPGLEPWDPLEFAKWARKRSSSQRHAALHVLSVWNLTVPLQVAKQGFDVMRAMSNWDEKHRLVFIAWAAGAKPEDIEAAARRTPDHLGMPPTPCTAEELATWERNARAAATRPLRELIGAKLGDWPWIA